MEQAIMNTAIPPTDERKLQLFIVQSDAMKNIYTNPRNTLKIQLGDYGAISRHTGVFEREGNIYELIAQHASKEAQSNPDAGEEQQRNPDSEASGTTTQDNIAREATAGNPPMQITTSDLFKNSDPGHFVKNMYKNKYGLDIDKLRPEEVSSEVKHTFLASCFEPSLAHMEKFVVSSSIQSLIDSQVAGLISLSLHAGFLSGEASVDCDFGSQGGAIAFAQDVKHFAMEFQGNKDFLMETLAVQDKNTLRCKDKVLTLLPKIWPELVGKVLITDVRSSPSYFMYLVTHKGLVRVTLTTLGTRHGDESGQEQKIAIIKGNRSREKWSLSGDSLDGGRLWSGQAEDDSVLFTPLYRGETLELERSRKRHHSCIIA